MSDIPSDPVIEEIIEAARQEITKLRHTIEKSGSATERLETIQQKIESGIERSRQLADSIIAVNEQLQRLATSLQSLQPDELVTQVESTSVAIENVIMPGIAALPGLIETSVSDLKAELNEQTEESQVQMKTEFASCRKMLIVTIALSALALITAVAPIVL